MSSEEPSVGRASAFFKEQYALIPKYYAPLLHLSVTAGIGAAAIALGLAYVEDWRWPLLATMLLFFTTSNLVEWLLHKRFLHERRRPLEVLYDQHTPRHHRFYVEDDMAVGDRREWYFVLMPKRAVAALGLLAIPLSTLVGWLSGADHGWVTLMTIGSYASCYEVLHLCYHLPKTHPVRRLPAIGRALGWLSRHHARHHDPRLMRKWNFNVTVPLWDFILGTNHWGRKAKEP